MRTLLSSLLLLLGGCADPVGDDADTPALPTVSLEDVVDDCLGENDTPAGAQPLVTDDLTRYSGLTLCSGETDHYLLYLAPGQYASVEVVIDGNGKNRSDLDLVEVDAAGEALWASSAEQPYERLAWFNNTDAVLTKILQVDGFEDAETNYDLLIRSSEMYEGESCASFFEGERATDQDGLCNEIVQVPQNNADVDGYFVEHEPHYSNLRREVIYLIREAARKTHEVFPDASPLAFMDMSQRDGDVPGRMVGQLRHPEGTHENGNDLDIAYFQKNNDNGGRAVCANDGYFCTGDADLMDADRTAYFMVQLLAFKHTRVIGIDPAVARELGPAGDRLVAQGLLTADEASLLTRGALAFGDGWPFHHHHMHFSWNWESGWFERREAIPDGCLTDLDASDRFARAHGSPID